MANDRNPWDDEIDQAVDQMLRTLDELPADTPPLGSRKLTVAEQIERYEEIREDPQAWMKLLEGQGLKEVVEYALKLEGLYRERALREQQEAEHGRPASPTSEEDTADAM